MAPKHLLLLLFILLLSLHPGSSDKAALTTSWMKSGYWFSDNEFSISDVESALFTHLICAFAGLDSSTYTLFLPTSFFNTFSNTVRVKNPSLTTLLSVGGPRADASAFSAMLDRPSTRKSFIDSSIVTARRFGFNGLDLLWPGSAPNTTYDMSNLALLLDEWRAAVDSESSSSNPKLVLTMAVHYSPDLPRENQVPASYPVGSMSQNLDWVHVLAMDYHAPSWTSFTAAHAALYDPRSHMSTDHWIDAWIQKGMPAKKMVLCLPFHGYAWRLADRSDTGLGAPSLGPAISGQGYRSYKQIMECMNTGSGKGATVVYDETYVVNYFAVNGDWVGFDDVKAVTAKVLYAKKKGLLGYAAWQLAHDYNWALSSAAARGSVPNHRNKGRLLAIMAGSVATVILLGFVTVYLRWRLRKSKGMTDSDDEQQHGVTGNHSKNKESHLRAFHFSDIKAATNNFSIETKLGEGGYGSVYKATLRKGKEIAVKRLSLTSEQGLEEFENEVSLTAKLQHVNLVKVLGFCTERDEKMLIYEYMPNKSLNRYIYDPFRGRLLDWEKRVEIIEGIIQGLLYLQEYSRLTIIHRDLKASNILLDSQMKPKISDFGMARIFRKGMLEANTGKIVGTYGYVPPEYVKDGTYSTKYDVYSFGVLLLQIISGKRNSCFYGPLENLNLLEYAFDLWSIGNGLEFTDPSLDDSSSPWKLLKCMQVALLCVQERGEDRPSMLEVFSMLKNETVVVPVPRKPAFSTQREGGTSTLPDICSNRTTMTEIVAR